MANAEMDRIIERVRKLLALAEDGNSEHVSIASMRHVHRLLAMHNLSIEDVRARPVIEARRQLDSTQFDPVVDRWTIPVWNATADLFFCRYFYREDGEHDRAGRWQPRRIRHCIIGTEGNQLAAKIMAAHFSGAVRRLARAHAAATGCGIAGRRSFETGCADRLVERIRTQLQSSSWQEEAHSGLPALLDLYSRESAANAEALAGLGVNLVPGKRQAERRTRDVLAQHRGRKAAEAISLSLQISAGPPSSKSDAMTGHGRQTSFPF